MIARPRVGWPSTLLALALLAAACGGSDNDAGKPDGIQSADQLWKGTVVQLYQYYCTARASAPVELAVRDGRFETTVTLKEVGSDCGMPMAYLWGSQTVTGELTEDRLTVEGAPTITGTVGRSGDRIDGAYTNSSPQDPNQKYTTTWDLQCAQGCG